MECIQPRCDACLPSLSSYAFVPLAIDLAKRLPTGLIDPRALEKFLAELEEMRCEPIGSLSRLMEAADACYYAAKSQFNSLIPDADSVIAQVITESGFSLAQILCAMRAKYECRIAFGKDPQRENDAVSHALAANGLSLKI